MCLLWLLLWFSHINVIFFSTSLNLCFSLSRHTYHINTRINLTHTHLLVLYYSVSPCKVWTTIHLLSPELDVRYVFFIVLWGMSLMPRMHTFLPPASQNHQLPTVLPVTRNLSNPLRFLCCLLPQRTMDSLLVPTPPVERKFLEGRDCFFFSF